MRKEPMNKNPEYARLVMVSGDKTDHLQRFEEYINKLGKKNLDLVIKKLNYLCLDFDPYALDKSSETENILDEFELDQFCSNPFDFTNVVLQMMDVTENLIKSREH
tara:strand:- start:21 stop:338 length:318 start_codon:yes stop_codon:yes gene_type:complete